MMRVLVTGAKGQLGYDCVRELKERGFNEVFGIDKDELDITNENEVHSLIRSFKPDAIIHNAAWTSVDKAEQFVEETKRINVDGVKYIAEAAEEVGAKMVYISTDYVFSGTEDKFYEIDDPKCPKSVYGKTKLDGEKVAKACTKLFVVRISWVFGINGNNFVKTMLKMGKTHKRITIVNDQIGSPTYTRDLSVLLCDMIETNRFGTYHATNEGVCSWYDFGKEIFNQTKLDVVIDPISTNDYLKINPQQAKRPLNSKLSKKSLDLAGFRRLPSWQDALHRFLKEINVI